MRSRTVIILFAGAVIMFVSFGAGVSYGSRIAAVTKSPLETILSVFSRQGDPSAIRTFEEVWATIHNEYVQGEIDDTALVRGAIRGIVGGLNDPYSVYFDPEEAKAFAEEISGTFEGVGMEIGFKEEQLAVIAPLPDTPAERAGLRAGDFLLQIDNQDTEGLSIDEAIKKIRGPKGSTVTFIIRRGTDEPKEIVVVRDTIVVSTVTSEIVTSGDHTIGYLKISGFTEDTTTKVRQEVQRHLAKSVDGFIVDVRNNPGGLLDVSVDIASIFVDNQVIVREVDQAGKRQELRSSGRRLVDAQPVVVLVNQGSASASEIVAGALQDLDRAVVIGEQTFGKGSVQKLAELPDGSTLKLTIAKWYTPKNRSISEQGITPDILVTPAADDEVDTQRNRAIEEIVKQLE